MLIVLLWTNIPGQCENAISSFRAHSPFLLLLPFHGCLSGTACAAVSHSLGPLRRCPIVSRERISSVCFRAMFFTEISEVSWSEEWENGRISYRNHALWLVLKESFTHDQTGAAGTHKHSFSQSPYGVVMHASVCWSLLAFV